MYRVYHNKKPKYINYLFKNDGVKWHDVYQEDFYTYILDYEIAHSYEFMPVKASIKYSPTNGYEVYAVYGKAPERNEYIGTLDIFHQQHDLDNNSYAIFTYGGRSYKIYEKEDEDGFIEYSFKKIYIPYEIYIKEYSYL